MQQSSQQQQCSSRSLTEVFILMRNNVIQSKAIFADVRGSGSGGSGGGSSGSGGGAGRGLLSRGGDGGGTPEDRLSLVSLNEENSAGHLGRIPPEWVNMVDEVQYEMSRVRTKIRELREAQTKYVLRPNFDDDHHSEGEAVIKAASDQILAMLTHCNRLIGHIRKTGGSAPRQSPDGNASQARYNASSSSSPGNDKLLENVIRALSACLAELTTEFRTAQQGYLHRLETREDSLQQYFDAAFSAQEPSSGLHHHSSFTSSSPSASLLNPGVTSLPLHSMTSSSAHNSNSRTSGAGGASVTLAAAFDDDQDQNESLTAAPGGGPQAPITMAQLQMIDEQSQFVAAREREILGITKSILELNTLFKDIGQIVVDQGSVVDRIDYNIEQSAVRVKHGLSQVKKAESYQKKNRKMLVILVLSVIIIVMLFFFIIHKS